MNEEKFEQNLKKICTEEIDIPYRFSKTIEETLYKKVENRRLDDMKRIVVSIISTILIGTGIVFAGTLYKQFQSNKGIEVALEHEYVQNIDMEYNIKDKIGIKVDTVILDNSNLGIIFDFKLPSKLNQIDDIVIEDNLIIKDDNNNIIFEDGNLKSMTTGLSKEIFKEKDRVIEEIILNNDKHTFPKSKQIEISFNKVKFLEKNKNIKEVEGDWNFKFDITNKFIEREEIEYIGSENEKVTVNGKLTSTSLDLDLKFKNKIDGEKLNIMVIDSKENEYKSNSLYIEDEQTEPKVNISFPISLFRTEENFKVIIKTDEENIIELNKVKNI